METAPFDDVIAEPRLFTETETSRLRIETWRKFLWTFAFSGSIKSDVFIIIIIITFCSQWFPTCGTRAQSWTLFQTNLI